MALGHADISEVAQSCAVSKCIEHVMDGWHTKGRHSEQHTKCAAALIGRVQLSDDGLNAWYH